MATTDLIRRAKVIALVIMRITGRVVSPEDVRIMETLAEEIMGTTVEDTATRAEILPSRVVRIGLPRVVIMSSAPFGKTRTRGWRMKRPRRRKVS